MATKLTPNFEVKLLMKPEEVLKSDGKLKDSVVKEFQVSKGSKKMSIQFVDTDKQLIYNSGWNLRIRKSEGEDTFGLTYKKRFKIDTTNNANGEANINLAVDSAHNETFDSSSGFEAQVETGYQQMTLSISNNAEVSDKGYKEMELPHAQDSRHLLNDNAPQQYNSWSASVQKAGSGAPLTSAIVYGPVHAKRYKGTWNDLKVFIEVWPIRKSKTDDTMENVVEASFKVDHLNEALDGRKNLAKHLEEKGWLDAKDSLKTKLIMERYGDVSDKS